MRLRMLGALVLGVSVVAAGSARAQGTPRVRDTFTGPSGTVLSAHTPDAAPTGSVWARIGGTGTATLQGGQVGTTGSGYEAWTLDAGASDVRIAVDVTSGRTRPYGGILLRAVDARNYFFVRYDGPYLYRRQNGEFIYLGEGRQIMQPGETHRLEIRASGDRIEVYSDGTLQMAVTDPAWRQVTRHGLLWNTLEDTARFDNFEVTTPDGPPVVGGVATQVSVAGADVSLTVAASDPEGTPLTFAATGLPPGLLIAADTGRITGRVAAHDAGTYPVTVIVSDGVNRTSVARTWIVAPAGTRLFDSFSVADGTGLGSHQPDIAPVGSGWSRLGGTGAATVRTGRAVSTGSGYEVWTTDTGLADVRLSVDVTSTDPTPYGGLVFRATDARNYFLLRFDGPHLYRRQNGEFVYLGGGVQPFRPGETHRLEVRASGERLDVYADGTLQFTAYDPMWQTATRHGLLWNTIEDPTAVFDNFQAGATDGVPVLDDPGIQTTTAGTSVVLAMVARDPEGTPLSFMASGLPPGLAIDAAGVVSGQVPRDSGIWTSTVTVSDGHLSASRTFGWRVVQPGARLFDAFSAVDGTPLAAHVPDVTLNAQRWTRLQGAGTVTIMSGAVAASGSQYEVWTVDAATADVDIAVDFTSADVTPYGGLVLRAADADNYLLVRYDGPYLFARQRGVWRLIASGHAAVAAHETHRLRVRVHGSRAEVYSDGVFQFDATVPIDGYATRHGLLWHPLEDAARFDNFEVGDDSIASDRVPLIDTPGDQVSIVGTPVALPVVAVDPDGASLRFSAAGLPPGLVMDPAGGWITGVAGPGGIGGYPVVLSVSDGHFTAERRLTWWIAERVDPATRVYDTFSDDGAGLLRHVPDVAPAGVRWGRLEGSSLPTLTGGRVSAAGPRYEVWTVDPGVADVDLSVDVTSGDPTPYGGLVFRASDAANYLMVRYDGPTLYRREAGSFTQLGAARVPMAAGETHRLRVRATGALIEVYSDGVLQFTATDAFQQAATRHGLMWYPREDRAVLDNFSLSSETVPPPDWRPACLLTLSTSSAAVTGGGGDGAFEVVTTADTCTWSAVSDTSWVQVTTGGTAIGGGAVTFVVEPNRQDVARSGTIRVGDQLFTVVQSGSAAGGCVYAVSPTSVTAAAEGRGLVVGVTAPDGCPWWAQTDAGFVRLMGVSASEGVGTASLAVEPNWSTTARAGVVLVAGQAITVVQAGLAASQAAETCHVVVTPASIVADSGASAFSLHVSVAPGCPWAVGADAGFVRRTGSGAGVGEGDVSYAVEPNGGASVRAAVVLVAGQPVTVLQEAEVAEPCLLRLTGVTHVLSHVGGIGAVQVETQAGCQWSAWSSESWVHVTAVTASTGPGTVWFEVDPNGTAGRDGAVVIGGEPFLISQAGPPVDPGSLELRWEIPYNGDAVGQCYGNCGRGCDSFFDPGCGHDRGWTHDLVTAPQYMGDDWVPVCGGDSGYWAVYPRYTAVARWTYHGYLSPKCEEHDSLCRELGIPIPILDGLECGILAALPLLNGSYCANGAPHTWSYEFVDIAHTVTPVAFVDGNNVCH